ncbi:hypothetical protein GCM10022393_17330 [Aquimarina addita]|uniref:Adhesin domain-containing protein n=2 Tax=Aquimarina addita TaxID=870485 RepID=A0ABP7XHU5_9FLAO
MDATGIKDAFIILDHTFELDITNTSENRIIINSVAEGEHQNRILIKAHRDNNSIHIVDDLQPFSTNYNDKLDAHKVIASKMKIEIPAHITVHVQSSIANVNIQARFKNLLIALTSGNCMLNSFIGNATINSTKGAITLFTKNATVSAYSKSGNVTSEKISGIYEIDLKSNSGAIHVYKIKEF